MRFHPSAEQVAIQDAVRGTLADVWPIQRFHDFSAAGEVFDSESWCALMALGLGGLLVDESAGGAGLGAVEAAMVCEVLGEAAAPGPVPAQMLTALAVHRSANASAKAHLPALVSGEKIATLGWGGNWLPESWDATPEAARLAHVEAAQCADYVLLGTAGGGLALVMAGPGMAAEPFQATDHSRPLAQVTLTGARAEPLFEAGDPEVARLFDLALVLSAASALGGAQHCVDQAVAYAREREQFGVAIGRFQALKHQLAQMALEVEPSRALVWYAGYALDAGLPDASRIVALAKAHLADGFASVARAAVAAHGGIGYTWEYGLNYWFRRSAADRIWLGGPALHRARAASLAGW